MIDSLQMEKLARPLPLTNAPLQYAPENELGVVYLFSQIVTRLQFRVEKIGAAFPDCIAYRHAGDEERRVRIEFEYRSSNFTRHHHDARKCDCIVCWHHDWHDAPARVEMIELKRSFAVSAKVWIQVALKSQCDPLDGRDRLGWALSPRTTHGDLLLMYRAYPYCCITDVFRYSGHEITRGKAGWREGEAYGGQIDRVCKLDGPVFLSDMRNHRALRTAPFIRRNMQGQGLLASEYWPYLYTMICERNSGCRKALAKYAPERM